MAAGLSPYAITVDATGRIHVADTLGDGQGLAVDADDGKGGFVS